jgi:hypothetical protein
MSARLSAICYRTDAPRELARFWAGLLGREAVGEPGGGVILLPRDDIEIRIRFVPGGVPKIGHNRMHFDLTSESLQDQRDKVARALSLGASHLDVGQKGDEGHVVLADPDGNAVDVIEPGNNFLAGCGSVGALSCDGTQAVGYFWSAALGWPLVWDQDQETAIQSPRGGTKITWGGPPVEPKTGPGRVFLELTTDGADVEDEADRLVKLGATRTGGNELVDPDGNEFVLRAELS